MARSGTYTLVFCKDYNGHQALFMMDNDDFRLSDERFKDNYEVRGDGTYVHRDRTFTVDGDRYKVFADHSLKLLAAGETGIDDKGPEPLMCWTVEFDDDRAFDVWTANTHDAHENMMLLAERANIDVSGVARRTLSIPAPQEV